MTRITKAPPERIRELAAEGYSQSMIATLLGVTREAIRKRCDRHHIVCQSGKYDLDKVERLRALAGEKMTASEAVRLAGYADGYAGTVFKVHGIKPPRKEFLADKCRKCADDGMTLSETARHLGRSTAAIWNTCNVAGITFTARGKPKRNRIFWTDEQRAELLARNLKGETLAEIGAEFGLTSGAIGNQIAKLHASVSA